MFSINYIISKQQQLLTCLAIRWLKLITSHHYLLESARLGLMPGKTRFVTQQECVCRQVLMYCPNEYYFQSSYKEGYQFPAH